MPKYIEYEKVVELFPQVEGCSTMISVRDLEKVPEANVAPITYSEWVRDGDFLICLNCESEINVKNSLGVENHKNFCPNCGAAMRMHTPK